MHHPFVIAALIISRWVVTAFRRNTLQGVHGATSSLDQAMLLSGWLSILWWAALGYSISEYVPWNVCQSADSKEIIDRSRIVGVQSGHNRNHL